MNCPFCGKTVLDTVKSCPYCGYDLNPSSKSFANTSEFGNGFYDNSFGDGNFDTQGSFRNNCFETTSPMKYDAFGADDSRNTVRRKKKILIPLLVLFACLFLGAFLFPRFKHRPVTDVTYLKTSSYECVCPMAVTTNDHQIYYIYLKYLGEPSFSADKRSAINQRGDDDISFLVPGNTTIEIEVPIGTYRLYYATGEKWQNKQKLFGDDTIYGTTDTLLDFYTKVERNMTYTEGHELILNVTTGGNLSTYEISSSEFPGSDQQ